MPRDEVAIYRYPESYTIYTHRHPQVDVDVEQKRYANVCMYINANVYVLHIIYTCKLTHVRAFLYLVWVCKVAKVIGTSKDLTS